MLSVIELAIPPDISHRCSKREQERVDLEWAGAYRERAMLRTSLAQRFARMTYWTHIGARDGRCRIFKRPLLLSPAPLAFFVANAEGSSSKPRRRLSLLSQNFASIPKFGNTTQFHPFIHSHIQSNKLYPKTIILHDNEQLITFRLLEQHPCKSSSSSRFVSAAPTAPAKAWRRLRVGVDDDDESE